MSLAAMPAFFSAAITFAAASEFSASAAAAVFASVVTPNDSVAVSGTTSTVPMPLTSTVPGFVSPPSACASIGAPTPAKAEASKSAPASQIRCLDRITRYTSGRPTPSHSDAERTLAEVRRPGVRDLRRGEADEEGRGRRPRISVQLQPRLLEQLVALA